MDERRKLELIDYHVTEAKKLLEELEVGNDWYFWRTAGLFSATIDLRESLDWIIIRVRGKLIV